MLIGQDVDSIDAYAQSVRAPGGVVGYTALDTLAGLSASANWGAGNQDLVALAGGYPGAPVALGLYLVGLLGEVNAGQLDSQIDQLAAALASLGSPVLLRIGYEFDNPQNAYDPATYQSAFVHITSRIRSSNRPSIATVWQSEAPCSGRYMGLAVDAWYPGDAYVDWIGLSYFQQMASCGSAPVDAMAAFARQHGKPLLVAESAPQGYDLTNLTWNGSQSVTASAIWSGWFQPYFAFIHANQDVVRAVSYIDADWNAQPMWQSGNGYWGDSRVQGNASIQEMWTRELEGSTWVQPQ